MAEFLKLQYGLTALRISLSGGGPDTRVQVDFQRSEEGETRTLASASFEPGELGIPSRLDTRAERAGRYQFRLPERFEAALAEFLGDQPPGVPLWIHLVQPYGFLAAVPWEGLLADRVPAPVLRLPDFIFRSPRRAAGRLDVAICASVPRAKAMFDAEEYVGRLLGAYDASLGGRATLHLFTDDEVVARFRGAGRGPGGAELRVYDPGESDDLSASFDGRDDALRAPRSGVATSPWLQWMQGSRKKTGFDVVHFVCHGYLSTNLGYLALAESPTRNEDRRSARFVGSAELNTFLNRVGAWATGFTSPDQNYSPMGLRLLADAIVRTRPGPMVCQNGVAESDWRALEEVLAFLFSPEPSTPPRAPGFFLSCQPSLVGELADWVSGQRRRGRSPPGDEYLRSRGVPEPRMESLVVPEVGDAPAWLSSAARYIEQRRWQIDAERTAAANPSAAMSKARRAELEATEEAIRRLEDMIHRHVSGGAWERAVHREESTT